MEKQTAISKYLMKDGREVTVDYLSMESIMSTSREDWKEIYEFNKNAAFQLKAQLYRSNIVRRINKMVDACSVIRTLSGTIVMYNDRLVIELKSLIADWDKFITLPVLDDGSIILYIDFKKRFFINENKKEYHIYDLSLTELKSLNIYLQHMIPSPSEQEVWIEDIE